MSEIHLLNWQLGPRKGRWHLQAKWFHRSVHWPPFMHGVGSERRSADGVRSLFSHCSTRGQPGTVFT